MTRLLHERAGRNREAVHPGKEIGGSTNKDNLAKIRNTFLCAGTIVDRPEAMAILLHHLGGL
jgi:hypothetical protein